MTEAELDELMARLSAGDRTAFEPLFLELHPRALRLARARLGDEVGVDVAQNALLRVFSRASEFDAGRPVLPWFYAIVANEIRTVSRRNQTLARRQAPEEALEHVAAGDDPESRTLERELRVALVQAIDALDEPSANALRVMLGEAPRPDVAATTFRKRVSRAVARLRAALGGFNAR